MKSRILAFAAVALLGVGRTPAADGSKSSSETEKVVYLSPFVVSSVDPQRYHASNSISGTALNTLLKDVPMTINVITSSFLEDRNVETFDRVFDYNSSTTQTTRSDGANRAGIVSIRGFTNRNMLLDGVSGNDFLPTYLIDRVEVVKGPNTLYGQSDPGGLVNVISKRPRAKAGASVGLRYDSWNTRATELDWNSGQLENGVRLRMLGSFSDTDGWRWLDDRKRGFGAFAADWQVADGTVVRVLLGSNRESGQPSNRATYPFMQVPTDLNGDGVIDRTVVNGVTEQTARYNNDFAPWEWTSQTEQSHISRDGTYAQVNVEQSLGSTMGMQYTFNRSDQSTVSTFREYNTFVPDMTVDAFYSTESNDTLTNGHVINWRGSFATGSIEHTFVAGIRYAKDENASIGYRLRPTVAAERAVLDSLESTTGARFRHKLSKADVVNGVEIWKDDIPTRGELIAAGFTGTSVKAMEQAVTTVYLSDSAAALDGRLRVLAGARFIKIDDRSETFTGSITKRSSEDSSFQVGANFALTKSVVLFGNIATAFNPNGFDNTTGSYYAPENSTAYEAGLKFDGWLGGKVSGSVSWFEIDKKNVVRSDYNPFQARNDTEVSDDQARGVDLELFIDLIRGWQTVVGYTYLDAKTVKSRTLALGLPLEGAAPQKFTIWTSYDIQKGALKGLRFGGGGIFVQGPIQQFGTSSNRYVLQDSYEELSVFARYTTLLGGRETTFGVNVNNLSDKFFIRARANTSSPRVVSCSVKMDF